jgi:hypothetical protein
MTSYNTLDGYIEQTITGEIVGIYTDGRFFIRAGETYYDCQCSPPVTPDKTCLGKQVTVTGLVEMYCGNAERMGRHVYEMIVKEILG